MLREAGVTRDLEITPQSSVRRIYPPNTMLEVFERRATGAGQVATMRARNESAVLNHACLIFTYILMRAW